MLMQSPLGSSPGGTGWQVPCLPATAHELQPPQLAEAQQNPSVQLPLKHSVPATQAAPLAFRFVQTLDMQVKPPAHSPSPVQVVRQAAPPQANGAQAHRRLHAGARPVAVADRREGGPAARGGPAAGGGGAIAAGAVAVALAVEPAGGIRGAAAVRLHLVGAHRIAQPRHAGDVAGLAVAAHGGRAADALDAVAAVAFAGARRTAGRGASIRRSRRCRRGRARSRHRRRRRRCRSCRCRRRCRTTASSPGGRCRCRRRCGAASPWSNRSGTTVGRTGCRPRAAGSCRCRRRSRSSRRSPRPPRCTAPWDPYHRPRSACRCRGCRPVRTTRSWRRRRSCSRRPARRARSGSPPGRRRARRAAAGHTSR